MKIQIVQLPIGQTTKVVLPQTCNLLDIRVFRLGTNIIASTLWAVPLPVVKLVEKQFTAYLIPKGEELYLLPGVTLIAGQITEPNEGVVLTEGVFK